MKLIFIILALLLLMIIAMWAISKLVRAVCNLCILIKYANKVDGLHHLEGSGFVVNKKTKQVEPSGSKINLPF